MVLLLHTAYIATIRCFVNVTKNSLSNKSVVKICDKNLLRNQQLHIN